MTKEEILKILDKFKGNTLTIVTREKIAGMISVISKSELTNADIEAWAEGKEHWKTNYKLGLIDGAQSMRDGLIKKIEK